MEAGSYFEWLARNTETTWWHDSGDPAELAFALEHGASGVTTNPLLCYQALASNRDLWSAEIQEALRGSRDPADRAGSLVKVVVRHAAGRLLPQYEGSKGESGYVCAQVNPGFAGQRDAMYRMAKEFSSIAPNIAVKLPVTSAGLDVLEQCAAEGVTATATVSFTVPQAIAVAESYRKGVLKAKAGHVAPGRCFAVIMVGRIDDYLRDVAKDRRCDAGEEVITQAGLAIVKRAYSVFRTSKYEAILLIAAVRGNYHMTELAGARLIMSIAPKYQKQFLADDLVKEKRIQREIPRAIIDKLRKIPEFTRAYEPRGMKREEFICYGATQRTLSQFTELGWSRLESFA